VGNVRRRVCQALVLAALVLAWVFFAPVQLGGSTLYSATVGISMVPLFHQGDLAVVRRASSYRVGDIALYESPVLHRPVLHRIVVIQDDRYYFKGDNNDFVDPGYATGSDLLGKLWFHVPRAGRMLGWFGAPTHTALLAGIASALLLLGGRRRPTGRRRSRRAARSRSSGAVRRSARPGFLRRPRKSAENIAGATLLGLAGIALAAGFGAPLGRTDSVTGFHQTGTFSYSARTLRPESAYPTGLAEPGQPLFLNDFDTLSLDFAYRFETRLAHRVHGTISLRALIASGSTWHELYTLEKTTRFSGDVVHSSGAFSLRELQTLTNRISLESGTVGAQYTIDLQPIVHVKGVVDGRPITSSFSPVLPFTLSPLVLSLAIVSAAAPPGATYAGPSPAATLAAGLHPTQAGMIPGQAANSLSLARYHVAVSTIRGIGIGLAALALLAFASKLFKRRREVWSSEKRIAVRYGCIVIDVVSFANGSQPTRPSTEVPDFESLATLARYCERPILRQTSEARPAYAVEDDGRLYVYRPTAAPALARLAAAGSS
jgi:signal peptidase I